MTNDLKSVPAAACPRCGGWTGFGGMSQYATTTQPVMNRTGCVCHRGQTPGKTLEQVVELDARKARLVELAHQIERAMDEICAIAQKDPDLGDLICEKYPFKGSLDEVSMEVNEWRFAMKEKS